METTRILYADVLFFVNFSMDCIVLYLTGRILHAKIQLARLIPAAAMGALYGVCAVLFDNAVFTAVFGTAVSALMCFIAMKPTGCPDLVRKWGLFWLVSAFLGGGMTMIFNLLNAAGIHRLTAESNESRGSFLFGAATVICVLFMRLMQRIGAGRIRAGTRAEVTVRYGGQSVHFDALVDSGNLLTDPLSGKPVIVASRFLFERMLPLCFSEAVTGESTACLETLAGQDILKRVRLIAVKGTSGDRILAGFLPDSVEIALCNTKERAVACDAVLALENADKAYFGGCGGTVPASLLRIL